MDMYDREIAKYRAIYDKDGYSAFKIAVIEAWYFDDSVSKTHSPLFDAIGPERTEVLGSTPYSETDPTACTQCATLIKSSTAKTSLEAQCPDLYNLIKFDPRIPAAAHLIRHPDDLEGFALAQRVADQRFNRGVLS
jgi:hypothetical protein